MLVQYLSEKSWYTCAEKKNNGWELEKSSVDADSVEYPQLIAFNACDDLVRTLSQKHFQCMKRFKNYLEKFTKLLGNIKEVKISK
jgi:hypothetical protein